MDSVTAFANQAMATRHTSPRMPLASAELSGEAKLKAASEFEAYVVGFMLNSLFEGIPTDGMMGGGLGENMFRSLLLEEYGKNIAQSGGLGIRQQILRALEQRQNQHSAPSFPSSPAGGSYDHSL